MHSPMNVFVSVIEKGFWQTQNRQIKALPLNEFGDFVNKRFKKGKWHLFTKLGLRYTHRLSLSDR